MSSEAIIHAGSCHCGAVKFEVRGPIVRAMSCTCSICSQVGAVWHGTDDAGLTITRGEDALTLYQFGTMTAKHYFCRTCGVHPFTRPRLDPRRWAVNLRCVDGVDLRSLQLSSFDGANWEQAAQAFLARLRGNSAG